MLAFGVNALYITVVRIIDIKFALKLLYFRIRRYLIRNSNKNKVH